jgi:hypothetical protein
MQKTILEILEQNLNSDWFTTPVKGELKRYIVALTDNVNPTIQTLEKQIESFSWLDNINLWGWVNTKDNIKYIDISTSFKNESDAILFWKVFNQKAIFDIEAFNEIRI